MNTFLLKIVTPDGLQYDGEAEKLIVRTISGDVAILPKHINYVSPLGAGEAAVYAQGNVRYGACIGGLVSVVDSVVTLVATTYEWADGIDIDRAEASEQLAEKILALTTLYGRIPTKQ